MACIDGFTLHAKLKDGMLGQLDKVFEIYARYNLTLSAKTCEFYSKKVKWCGRIIDS